MLSPYLSSLKVQLEEEAETIKNKLDYFKSIEFEEYQSFNDMRSYNKMLQWLKRTNEELERIMYNDDFSML